MCNFFKRTNNKAKIHNNTVRRRTHQYRRVKVFVFNMERETTREKKKKSRSSPSNLIIEIKIDEKKKETNS
jgi:hypothetical protein